MCWSLFGVSCFLIVEDGWLCVMRCALSVACCLLLGVWRVVCVVLVFVDCWVLFARCVLLVVGRRL